MLIFTAQPNVVQYCWQTRVQIVNFTQFGYDKLLNVLVLLKKGEPVQNEWLALQKDYPKVKFFFYEDEDGLYEKLIIPLGYEPLVRPYLFSKHFNTFPSLSGSTFFYIDSDVLFVKAIDFDRFLNDETVYMSNTVSYIGSSYFDSKVRQVIPEKLEEYKTVDVLNNCTRFFGINRSVAEENNINSGGAQYLLKNVGAEFWTDVLKGCVFLKKYLRLINETFFVNENEGFQSYCSDMWSILYCLWARKIETKCPQELNFTWATDHIKRLDNYSLYHDAGMTPFFKNGFMKSHYRNVAPDRVKASSFNQDFCTSWYVSQIENAYLK